MVLIQCVYTQEFRNDFVEKKKKKGGCWCIYPVLMGSIKKTWKPQWEKANQERKHHWLTSYKCQYPSHVRFTNVFILDSSQLPPRWALPKWDTPQDDLLSACWIQPELAKCLLTLIHVLVRGSPREILSAETVGVLQKKAIALFYVYIE